ncbi:MAG: manganese transporter, partial [Thermoprotei archaeon]
MARALLLGVLLAAALAPALQAQGERPVVVCTTTVLASMVRDLAGDLVVIEVIASPAVCPAHYDVKPSDVEAFGRADLILAHGIE